MFRDEEARLTRVSGEPSMRGLREAVGSGRHGSLWDTPCPMSHALRDAGRGRVCRVVEGLLPARFRLLVTGCVAAHSIGRVGGQARIALQSPVRFLCVALDGACLAGVRWSARRTGQQPSHLASHLVHFAAQRSEPFGWRSVLPEFASRAVRLPDVGGNEQRRLVVRTGAQKSLTSLFCHHATREIDHETVSESHAHYVHADHRYSRRWARSICNLHRPSGRGSGLAVAANCHLCRHGKRSLCSMGQLHNRSHG